jgi:hypothetical protein
MAFNRAFPVVLVILSLIILGMGSAFFFPRPASGEETSGVLLPSFQPQSPGTDSTAAADFLGTESNGTPTMDTPDLLIEIALLMINLM